MTEADGPTAVLYIAGDGRSGSTLIESLIADATGAVAVGEIRMFLSAGFRWGARCGCGEPFTECAFWREVLDEAMPGVGEADRAILERSGRALISNRRTLHLLRGRDAWSDDERRSAALHVDLYRAIARVSGTRLIVDSSKTPAYGLFLAAQPELDVRVVHLVRDGRAVAHSWTRRKTWKAAAVGEQRLMKQLSTRRAARQWFTTNLFCEFLRNRVDHAVTVRYEDLAADPTGVVERVLSELGVERSAAPSSTEHGFLGNPIRFDSTPRAIVLDDAWTVELPAKQRRLATLLTFPLLLRPGYPLRRRGRHRRLAR